MIAAWLAGKASGMIIFCVACLSVILLPMVIVQTVRIDGLDLGGWYAVKGYKPLYEGLLIENGTLRNNNDVLDRGLKTCNASVDGIAAAGKALTNATAALIAQARAGSQQLVSNAAAIKAIKSTNEKCPVADAILTRGFQ